MKTIMPTDNPIENKIHTIRGVQVMLDEDLATLYGVETKQLNKAVSRNTERFPDRFRFQLTRGEYDHLRFQIGTSSPEAQHGGRRYLPYAFTEQGVSMLSAVLRSQTAVEVSIKIIDSFVSMRKFIASNAHIFYRFERVEQRLSLHDEQLEQLLGAIENKATPPKQHIFYDGQIFDAYLFACDIIKSAKTTIRLIDNYIDESVLILLTKRADSVKATIYTKTISKQLEQDLKKHNTQYPPIDIKQLDLSHDRFLIMDEKEVYHFGASLKDLGKKWFAVSKMDIDTLTLIGKVDLHAKVRP
ncbi:ORF6N domain-containing protein [Chrysiogenes arsenatis]|uniref:ORF6N domain-containing protein n=1 Tax=Chrysiogenes arsenatis TaxID=309797 RepID=UPI000423191B|nr:ORF6N domain-containing protein [Chrysiogenes arsenatis]